MYYITREFFFFYQLLEIYKRVNSAKSKKKQLQPKEKDQAWTALKQREALFKSLENV